MNEKNEKEKIVWELVEKKILKYDFERKSERKIVREDWKTD